jgi:hypothetical protein
MAAASLFFLVRWRNSTFGQLACSPFDTGKRTQDGMARIASKEGDLALYIFVKRVASASATNLEEPGAIWPPICKLWSPTRPPTWPTSRWDSDRGSQATSDAGPSRAVGIFKTAAAPGVLWSAAPSDHCKH